MSFSASNDHKYIVMDSKLHPPVGSRQTPQPRQQPRLPLPASLSVISNKAGGKVSNQTLANLMSNKRPGLTVTRGPGQGGSPSRPPPAKVPRVAAGVAKPRSILPAGANVLSSGEVVGAQATAAEPCTPYCPGVTGFPDLECTRCQSLFHSKCVGISEAALNRIRSSFKCRICTPAAQVPVARAPARVGPKSKVRGSGVTIINLD